MIGKGFVTQTAFKKHLDGDWRTVHELWSHIRNYMVSYASPLGDYYTKTELDTGQLDNRYYTETETDAFFEGYSGGKAQVDAGNVVGLTQGSIPFADSSGFLTEDNTSLFFDDTKNTLGIGTTSFGANMILGIQIKTGTAPTGNVADTFAFYSADFAAGNACPYFRTENGAVIGLNQSLLTTDAPAFATGVVIGNLTLANGSITDSGGSISFGNENLSTTGTLGVGKLTVNSGVDQAIIIKGTGSGNANLGWIGFYDSDGTTRRGCVGDTASGNDDIVLRADTGDLKLLAAGTVILPTGSTIGNLTLANGSITDSGGAISFGDENLTTTGKVGIGGAVDGTYLFKITSATDEYGTINTTGANTQAGFKFINDARSWIIKVNGSDKFVIRDVTGGADRVTIDTAGNVGIGTASPDVLLHMEKSASPYIRIKKTVSETGVGIVLTDAAVGEWVMYNPSNSSDIRFSRGGDLVTIDSVGAMIVVGCVADGTCEIMKNEDALSIIDDILKTGSGKKDKYDHERMDMKKIHAKYPFMIHEQITEDEDGKKKKGYFDKLGAKSDLIYVAIGQLKEKIEALEVMLNN